MGEELHARERRRHIRFNLVADAKDLEDRAQQAVIHIDVNGEGTDFAPTLLAVLIDESHSGCSAVITRPGDDVDSLKAGKTFLIKVGLLHVMRAEVRWCRELDERIYKIGFKYLE